MTSPDSSAYHNVNLPLPFDPGSPDDLEAEFTAFCTPENWLRVRNLLRSHCGDTHLVEDVVQEAFVKAWDRWPRIRAYQKPLAWVYRVALRDLVRHSTRTARQTNDDLDDVVTNRIAAPADPNAAMEALLDLLRLLRPVEYAQVLYLDALNWTDVEIAALLGVTLYTVRSYKKRARRQLQEILERDEQEFR